MLSVTEAQKTVLEHAKPLPPELAPLSSTTLGLVLAEDVESDLDMPPYDKSLMDGYAVRCADLLDGEKSLTVIEEIPAGATPKRALAEGQCARIMTGAPIPDSADAVVMIERTEMTEAEVVKINDEPKPEQNILRRGREMQLGQVVLKTGSRLRPQEFGLLASVGKTAVQVYPAPVVTILATGDELVEPYLMPGPGQIRNSNGPMLTGQVCRAGGVPKFLGIARDTEESLRKLIGEGLGGDILILSGGVSAGKKDLVPGVLKELGVTAHFHKIEMKPGKPLFFGTREQTLIFGLPGNPVSSFVCFELFVRPAIRRLQNQARPAPPLLRAALSHDFRYQTNRPTYHPARLEWKNGKYVAALIPWFGSPDLRGLTSADALVIIDKGEHQFQAGAVMDVLPVEYTC